MRPLNLLERLQDWFIERWKRIKCSHSHIATVFTAEKFLIDKWERCSGVGDCKDCGLSFHVSIPANKQERQSEHYLGY
jgi:hypothetical protein